MDVPFSPDEQARIDRVASVAGQGAGEFVRQIITAYIENLDQVRDVLSNRYDDIKSGRVKPIDGEEAFARLRRAHERRAIRS